MNEILSKTNLSSKISYNGHASPLKRYSDDYNKFNKKDITNSYDLGMGIKRISYDNSEYLLKNNWLYDNDNSDNKYVNNGVKDNESK